MLYAMLFWLGSQMNAPGWFWCFWWIGVAFNVIEFCAGLANK